MSTDDVAYYQARAIEELDRAAASTDPNVARVHLELANRYEALAARDDVRTLSDQLRDLEGQLCEIDATLTRERGKLPGELISTVTAKSEPSSYKGRGRLLRDALIWVRNGE